MAHPALLSRVAAGASATCRGAAALRLYATSPSSSAVDQMIEYAMGQRKTNPNMAVDVLLSGLSYSSPDKDPMGAARLHMAMAQIEVDRNAWGKVHTHASGGFRLAAAAVGTAPAAAELTLAAGSLSTRALLLQGQDTDAQSLAADCERALRPASSASPSGPSLVVPHTRSLGLLALAVQAAGGAARGGEPYGRLAVALGSDVAAVVRADPALADAAHALGLLAAGRWQTVEAEAAFSVAEAAAEAARAQAGASSSEATQQHNYEVEADALAGRAQLQMRAREWGPAEELLGSALKAAEAANGERSTALVPLLTLLGYTYSRSARVTFAEGLYREAAKLLQLDPARQQQPAQQQQGHGQEGAGGSAAREAAALGVHASAGAVLAWRYAQLLWVLPNRGGEAARWEGVARHYWAGCGGLASCDIAAVLGGESHLKGEGPEGSGVVFSTRFRRAWQCLPLTK